jgi:hypothetical protein
MVFPLQELADPSVPEKLNGHGSKMHGQAVDIKSLLWLYRCWKEKGGTQMRRMLKDAAYAEGEEGGPLSKIHAAAGSGTRSLAVVSRTTTPVWTIVT